MPSYPPNRQTLALWRDTVHQQRIFPETEVAVGAFIPNDRTYAHDLETATFFPAFSLNFNGTVWLTSKDAGRFTVGISFTGPAMPSYGRLSYRLSTEGGSTSVSANALTTTVTHNLGDATAALFFAPSWNTLCYIVSKAANSMVVGFSTAPSTAQTVYYSQHSHYQSTINAELSISANARTRQVTHSLGKPFCDSFFTPSFNTNCWVYDRHRNENDLTVTFSVPPSASETLDAVSGVQVA